MGTWPSHHSAACSRASGKLLKHKKRSRISLSLGDKSINWLSHTCIVSAAFSCGYTCGKVLIFQKISAYDLTNLSPQGGLSSPTRLSVMTGHAPVSVPLPCLQCAGSDLSSPGQTRLWVILLTTSETHCLILSAKCRLAGSMYQNKSLSSGL